jgi:uncharacterized protein (TIGR03067 family)
MTIRTSIALGLVVLLCSAVDGGTNDDKNIQGNWAPTSAEIGGKKLPDEFRASMRLVVKDGMYTVTIGKQIDQGTVKLNLAAKPKAMDITGAEGPNKGKTMQAIYELDGDILRICYDVSGKGRPTEFRTEMGTPHFLVTYQRQKE